MMVAVLGSGHPDEIYKALNQRGFTVIELPDNPYVDPRLSGHADLSACKTDLYSIVLAEHLKYSSIVNILTMHKISPAFSEVAQDKRYPYDANLCAAISQKYYIHNLKFSDPAFFKYMQRKQIISVQQGYSACCCRIIGDAIITNDIGIFKKAKEMKVETLYLEGLNIILPGFSKGFFGGASFTSNNILYLTGTVPNDIYKLISEFCLRHGFQCEILTNGPIIDIGGIISFDSCK